MTTPKAYYSREHDCWFVPVSSEMHDHFVSVEPVRLELKDNQLWITQLPTVDEQEGADS